MKKKKMSLEPWGIYAVSGLKATKKEREKKKKRKGEKIERCFAESRVVGEVTRHVKIKNGKFDNFLPDRKRVSEIYRNARNEVLLNAVISTPATIFRR